MLSVHLAIYLRLYITQQAGTLALVSKLAQAMRAGPYPAASKSATSELSSHNCFPLFVAIHFLANERTASHRPQPNIKHMTV